MGKIFSKSKPDMVSAPIEVKEIGENSNEIISNIINQVIDDVWIRIELNQLMKNMMENIEMRNEDMNQIEDDESQSTESNSSGSMIQSNEVKLELIVKPCQSGKTFLMIEELIKNFVEHTTSNWIHIIFTDNSILQTEQLQRRLDENEDLDLCIENEISNSVVLSSNSRVKDLSTLLRAIQRYHHRNVITLSNHTRIIQISELINKLTDWNFSIWIDEADKTFVSDENILKIQEWKLKSNVDKITFITATPKKLFEKYTEMYVYPLCETFDSEKYNSIDRCNILIENSNSSNTILYIESILDKNSSMIQKGQSWFIPGDFRKRSHEEIRDKLLRKGFAVILINGDEKSLNMKMFDKKTKKWIKQKIMIRNLIRNPDELSVLCGNIYEEYHLQDTVVAITGNMCISRGITISSPKMMITHAILPPDISDKCNAYQLAGRLCGNIRHFENYQQTVVFMTDQIKQNLFKMEQRAMNFAKMAYRQNPEESTILTKVYYNKSFLSRVFHFSYKEFMKGEENKLQKYKKKYSFSNRSLETRKMDETGRFYLSSVSTKLKILSYDEIIHAIQYDGYSRLDITEEKCSDYHVGKKISRLYIGYKDLSDPDSVVYILFIGEVVDILH